MAIAQNLGGSEQVVIISNMTRTVVGECDSGWLGETRKAEGD